MERILRAGVEAGEAAVAAICKGDLLLDGDVSGGADLGAGAAEDAIAVHREVVRCETAVSLFQQRL